MVKFKLSTNCRFVNLMMAVFTVIVRIECATQSTKPGSNVNRNFIHIQQPQLQSSHQQPSGRSTSHHHHQHQQPDEAPKLVNNNPSVKYSLTDESIVDAGTTTYLNPSGLPDDVFITGSDSQPPQQQIFINQSNNIYILATYGQTINLPCIVFKQKQLDLSNVHVIWHRLYERSRPVVLSIGLQQLKQDMRYRVKVLGLNKPKSSTSMSDEPLVFDADNSGDSDIVEQSNDLVKRGHDHLEFERINTTTSTADPREDYLIQNWQFEIRKVTFDDAGTYQCLLPLVKPISKNITLQVRPDLTIEPKEGQFKVEDKIVLKCRATLRSVHKSQSMHLIHQRQSKSSILWYKENEIIKSSASARNGNNEGAENDRKIEIETKIDNNEQTLNSILTIHKARESDSGNYRCIYDNFQRNIEIKISNEHYEYKNYMSSANSATGVSITTAVAKIFCLFIFIQSVVV